MDAKTTLTGLADPGLDPGEASVNPLFLYLNLYRQHEIGLPLESR